MDVEKIAMVAGVGFALAIGAFVLWGPSPRPRRRGNKVDDQQSVPQHAILTPYFLNYLSTIIFTYMIIGESVNSTLSLSFRSNYRTHQSRVYMFHERSSPVPGCMSDFCWLASGETWQ